MENLLELLKQRRTSRVFTDELIDKDTVCNLMKAVLDVDILHRLKKCIINFEIKFVMSILQALVGYRVSLCNLHFTQLVRKCTINS